MRESVAWLGIILGGSYMLTAARREGQRRLARGWHQGTGTVDEVSITPGRYRQTFGGYETRFRLHVRYSYAVNGQYYIGERLRLAPDPVFRTAAEAETQARNFARGATIALFYDPSAPSHSVVNRDDAPGVGPALAVGALLTAMSLWSL